MRHYSRRTMDGGMEIVDREFDFVRAVLPYDYRYTCNAQQYDEAERICLALEGPMISGGVVRVREDGTMRYYGANATSPDAGFTRRGRATQVPRVDSISRTRVPPTQLGVRREVPPMTREGPV